MKKKIVSLVLALSMILSCAHALAEEADAPVADGSYREYLTLVSALGINEGIEKSEGEGLTRAEFAAMAVRLIGADCTVYEPIFGDVGEDAPFSKEIITAKRLGVVNGVSETLFSPDSSVTYGQAVKMIVSALGLDKPAAVGGGYPTGYYMVAKNLDILYDITYANDNVLTHRDAIALIYNALLSKYVNVSEVKVDDPESILYYKESSIPVITKFFGYYIEEGVAWTAGKSSMHLGVGKDNTIEIDGVEYIYYGADIQSYLGLKVKIIYDKYFKVISVITSSGNNVYELIKDDIKEYTGSSISYYTADNRVKKYNLDSGYTKLRNWRVTKENGFAFQDGKLILIDNNSDRRIDVVHIQSPDTILVSSFSDNTVYDMNEEKPAVIEDGIKLVSGADSKYIDVDELLPNMVLSVYKDSDGNVTNAVAGYNILHGATIDSIEKTVITIDGVPYETNAYFKKYYSEKEIEAGSRITAYFDTLGKLAAIEKYTGSGVGGMTYGYLLGARFDGSFGEAKLNILTTSNEKKAFTLKDKVIIDGVGMSRSAQSVKDALINPANGRAKYMIIKYSADADGNISRIDTPEFRAEGEFEDRFAESSWSVDNSLTCYVQKGKAMYRGTGNFFPYCIYSNPVVFEVPKALATNPNEYYELDLFSTRQKGFTDNDKVIADFYDYDSGFAAGAIVNYCASGSGITPMDIKLNSPMGFVKNVTEAIDSEGDGTYAVTMFKDGAEVKFLIAPDILPYFVEKELIPSKGDLLQYELDGLGNIAGINLIKYNKGTRTFTIDMSKTGDTILSQNTFVSGKIYSVSSTHIAFKASTKPSPYSEVDLDDDIIFRASSGQKYVIYDIEKDEIRTGTFSDVKTINSVGEDEASDVIMFLDWSHPKIIGVYNR